MGYRRFRRPPPLVARRPPLVIRVLGTLELAIVPILRYCRCFWYEADSLEKRETVNRQPLTEIPSCRTVDGGRRTADGGRRYVLVARDPIMLTYFTIPYFTLPYFTYLFTRPTSRIFPK